MSQQLITYGTDRRLALANGEAIRQPIWYDSWNRIRIGLLFAIDRNASTANIGSTPGFSFGLCSGTTNVWISGTSDHVVGVRNVNATWTYQTSPVTHYTSGSNAAYRGFKRVGTTVTDASAAFSNNLCAWPESTRRNAMILEIEKGTPNYGMKFWTNNATGAQSDVTEASFEEAMVVDDMASVSGVSGIGGGTVDSTARTLAVDEDESDDGPLDHIFIYWERTLQFFTFNIRHRKMA